MSEVQDILLWIRGWYTNHKQPVDVWVYVKNDDEDEEIGCGW